ncbi:MAG: alpha/beta fold hydrolase [Myxococcaceae bacterium]
MSLLPLSIATLLLHAASVTKTDAKPAPSNENILLSGVPALPADLTERVRQYSEVRGAEVEDLSPDGKELLITTRFGNTQQLHRVVQPLGTREQLTFFQEPVSRARFVPNDRKSIVYRQDKGGGEFYQLFKLDLQTGRAQLLTDGKSRHEAFALSRDGKQLAYSGTGRNGKDTDVYLATLGDPSSAKRVTELEGSHQPLEFSPDGRWLLVQTERAIDDSDLYVVDLKDHSRHPLTPDVSKAGKAGVRDAVFSADGKSVLVSTDRDSEFFSLRRIAVDKPGVLEPLAPKLIWNVESIEVAPDKSTVAFTVNEDGYSKLYILRGKVVTPLAIPAGVMGRIRFATGSSDLLTFSIDTPTSPRDVWKVSLKNRALTRWTKSEVGGLDTSSFVTPTLVRYPASGLQLPAFLYKPKQVTGRIPVVVMWHGGPEGQSRPQFSSSPQLLVELGMAVLLPNVRGSDGYGKAFLAADDGIKREESLKDIGATLDFIASQPDLDTTRVAAVGGSYGGYLTLASVAFYPDRFKAAVDIVGVSRIASFLENTQAYRRDLRRVEYGDERIAEVRAVQERISPLNAVDKIQASLFVQQGKNDPRVPQSEAEQLVQALKAKGKDVWYLLALNEGHGFRRKENRELTTLTLVFFLKQKLVDAGRPS